MVDEIKQEEIEEADIEFETEETKHKLLKEEPETTISYESIIDEQPEIKQFLEYKRLEKKFTNGGKLSEEELKFMHDIEEVQKKEQDAVKAQEEQLRLEKEKQEEYQAKILKEYRDVKEKTPEKIIAIKESEVTLSGGTSIPKLIKFIFTLNKAKKKWGKVLVQVFRSRKVLVKWTSSDITFVEFYTTDEKGNELMEVTRFSEYPYSFEGTPIPVLFAVQGYSEGFDFFSEFRKDLSSEMVSRLITRAFHAGYMKGAEVAQPNKKSNLLEGLMQFTPIILIGGFIVMGYLLYTMYQDNTLMLHTMQSIQGQLSAMQTPDVNALILR